MYIRVTLMVFLAFIAADSSAQFWKKKKNKEEMESAYQRPTSLNPSYEKKEHAPKARAAKRSSKGPTYGLEQQYYERMGELEKERRKNEKLMEKPQYSNPLYFGHKRPPKKRKPSRMKFCKECGIRH